MFDNLVIIAHLANDGILACVVCDTLELKEILCGLLDSHCTLYAAIDNTVYTDVRTVDNFRKWDFLYDGMEVVYI